MSEPALSGRTLTIGSDLPVMNLPWIKVSGTRLPVRHQGGQTRDAERAALGVTIIEYGGNRTQRGGAAFSSHPGAIDWSMPALQITVLDRSANSTGGGGHVVLQRGSASMIPGDWQRAAETVAKYRNDQSPTVRDCAFERRID